MLEKLSVIPLTSVTDDSLIQAIQLVCGLYTLVFVISKNFKLIKRTGEYDQFGSQQIYYLSGLFLFIFVSIVLGVVKYLSLKNRESQKVEKSNAILQPILTEFWSLFIISNLFAFFFSFILFIADNQKNNQKKCLQSVVSFFNGVEQNPEFLGVDLKLFFLQISQITNLIFALAFGEYQLQYQEKLTIQMKLYLGFWFIYLFSHYLYEEYVLQTNEFTKNQLGFTFVWGRLVFSPYFYSIIGWFVADNMENLSEKKIALIAYTFLVGLVLLRVSDWQQSSFKYYGTKSQMFFGRVPKSLDGKLLISGFWGMGRHLNYNGKITVFLALSVCSGCKYWYPYLIPLCLALHLILRALVIENQCNQTYRENWDSYCKIAKFRMIPKIF